MSTVRSTPQTRSQTKRVGTSRTSSLAAQTADIPQQLILFGTAISVVAFAVISVVYVKYHQKIIQVPKLKLITDRLVYTLQLQTYSLIPLFISLNQIMFTRLFSNARNPLSGNEKLVEKPVRILTNTLEQLIANVFNQLILVTFIPAEYLFVIPFLVFTFTFARICFIIGYNIHPKFRTFGFVLTFVPTFILFMVNILYATGLNKFVSLQVSAEHAKKVEL